MRAISVSREKGMKKQNVPAADFIEDHGIQGDAHAGPWHRQVSLLMIESIGKIAALGVDVSPGDFAENLTTEGFDLLGLKIGDRVRVGPALLEITQIGKECHSGCAIFEQVGDCVMPREGLFARVIEGGRVRPGDPLEPGPAAGSRPA